MGHKRRCVNTLQDTVVGLNALAEFAERLATRAGGHKQYLNIAINMDDGPLQSFKPLTQQNKVVLQSIEVRYNNLSTYSTNTGGDGNSI